MEIQLRLAEHHLALKRLHLASEQYAGSQPLLEALLAQDQIKAKTIKTCLHVMSKPSANDAPDCEERSQILEMLQPHLDGEEASTDNMEDEATQSGTRTPD
jgi:hypothetical protein